MYAIFRSGAHQYKVAVGDIIKVQRRQGANGEDTPEPQSTLVFDDVLAMHDGTRFVVGTPRLEAVKVLAEVDGEVRGRKITSIKFLRRSRHKTQRGHRQRYTQVRITEIAVADGG